MDIGGKPLIVRAWETAMAQAHAPVVVATDSEEIAAVIRTAGGTVLLSGEDFHCGSDRIGEAIARIDPESRYDTVVNMQGDLPCLPAGAISAAIGLLQEPETGIGTLAVTGLPRDHDDPNAVKIICSKIGPHQMRALYFTRACAPWGDGPIHKHLGVYAFRRSVLDTFTALPPSPLEIRENLEQLRAVEAGIRIDAFLLDNAVPSVDTERDLAAASHAAISQDQS